LAPRIGRDDPLIGDDEKGDVAAVDEGEGVVGELLQIGGERAGRGLLRESAPGRGEQH
jgi:hypothetical protein